MKLRDLARHVGDPFIGWLQFQTSYDQLVAQQPDRFESSFEKSFE
ncbi:hypothetical protein [Paraburkholderia sp. BCC1884]|nr:hypothetical protein [Paraburkholderia sp. BCC1884]